MKEHVHPSSSDVRAASGSVVPARPTSPGESKHTPGPWDFSPKLSGSENHRGFTVWECGKSWVLANVIPVDTDGIEGGANARLMAAAPDLLAALIEMEREKSDYMRRNFLGNPAEEHTNKMARAAIALATGAPHAE